MANKPALIKVYLRHTGQVINEQEGTVMEHYQAVTRLNGLPQLDSVMAANIVAAQRKVCMSLKTINIKFVNTIKEALQ